MTLTSETGRFTVAKEIGFVNDYELTVTANRPGSKRHMVSQYDAFGGQSTLNLTRDDLLQLLATFDEIEEWQNQ